MIVALGFASIMVLVGMFLGVFGNVAGNIAMCMFSVFRCLCLKVS